MAAFTFQTITASQALNYSGAGDSVAFGGGSAAQASVAYLGAPEQVVVSYAGLAVTFGTGVYGDLDLRFDNGGMVFAGGVGADNATGTAVADAMFGGAGADTLSAAGGGDLLQGNQGGDSLSGGDGSDTIYGGQDNDVIVLGSGSGEANWGIGNRGEDTITASAGADIILGGQGNDRLIGGSGGDHLNGNLGDDTIIGGVGADTVLGEGGYDVLTGGGGSDTFVFGAGSSEVNYPLADRILDWSSLYRMDIPIVGGYAEIAGSGPPPPPAPDYGYAPVEDPYGYAPPPAGAPADDFAAALTSANSAMNADGNLKIVAVQSGSEVAVFVDTDGNRSADLAIILFNSNLSALDAGNFI